MCSCEYTLYRFLCFSIFEHATTFDESLRCFLHRWHFFAGRTVATASRSFQNERILWKIVKIQQISNKARLSFAFSWKNEIGDDETREHDIANVNRETSFKKKSWQPTAVFHFLCGPSSCSIILLPSSNNNIGNIDGNFANNVYRETLPAATCK